MFSFVRDCQSLSPSGCFARPRAARRFRLLHAPADARPVTRGFVVRLRVRRSLVMASVCICLMTNAVEHIFMHLSATHICCFVSCLFERVASFKIGLLAFISRSFWILVFC